MVTTSCQTDYLVVTTTLPSLVVFVWWWWPGGLGSPLLGGTSPTVNAGGGVGGRSGLALAGDHYSRTTTPCLVWWLHCTPPLCAVHPTDGAPAVLPLLHLPLAPPAGHVASHPPPSWLQGRGGGGTSRDPMLPAGWMPLQPAGSRGSSVCRVESGDVG